MSVRASAPLELALSATDAPGEHPEEREGRGPRRPALVLSSPSLPLFCGGRRLASGASWSRYGSASDDVTVSAGGVDDSGPQRLAFTIDTLKVPHIVLEHQIGEGGMGSVWYGTHETLRAPVAVKFLRPSLVEHPVAVARFQREAAASARLRSANVVQVFDHGFTECGVPYIVMEWLEGCSLQQRWDAEGCLSVPDTIEIVRQVARALARAHSIGIVHRDIKPDNIFLVSSEGDTVVKVLDFGIAKVLEDDGIDRVTADGLVIGTPHFMSPEQMVGSPDVGPAADVWALGVVAYACVTGRLPYEANNIASLALAMDRVEPIPVGRLAPSVPHAFEAWIERALRVHPEHRFPDGRSALEAFERTVCRGSSDAQPYTSLTDARAWEAGTPGGPGPTAYGAGARRRARGRRDWWAAGLVGAVAAGCIGLGTARLGGETLALAASSGATVGDPVTLGAAPPLTSAADVTTLAASVPEQTLAVAVTAAPAAPPTRAGLPVDGERASTAPRRDVGTREIAPRSILVPRASQRRDLGF
ncbi:MAG: serine/threonine-protein kinase [Polyangiaceae bacterium]